MDERVSLPSHVAELWGSPAPSFPNNKANHVVSLSHAALPFPQGHKSFLLSHHLCPSSPSSPMNGLRPLFALYDFAAAALCLGFCQAAMIYGSWWRPSDSQ